MLSKDACVRDVDGVVNGSEPWLLESSDQIALVRRVENDFPTLEGVGCKVVDLQNYPRLARYLDERKSIIAKRHCARKSPANWYRTIDRIWPELTRKPKLLIPDIKGKAHIVYEPGKLYPHHSLKQIKRCARPRAESDS